METHIDATSAENGDVSSKEAHDNIAADVHENENDVQMTSAEEKYEYAYQNEERQVTSL